MDPSKKNYQEYDNEYGRRQGGRNRRQQENPEEEQFDRERQNKEFREFKDRRDRREQRDQKAGRRNNRNQKEEVVTMYVKKGEQQGQDQQPRGRKGQDEQQQKTKRGRQQERVIYVKKGDSEPTTDANANVNAKPNPRSNARANRRVANPYLEDEGHAWQNDVEDEEVETIPQGKTQVADNTKESPSKHYNEHNIHEFFKTNNNNTGTL